MKARLPIPSLIFYGLTAIIIFSSIFSLAKALSWLNKPFPGFLVYHPPYVGSFSSRDWPGKQAGLRYIDRILSMDGKPVQFGREVVDAVREKDPGTPVRYVVRSKGEVREVTVPVKAFDLKDFFVVCFPTTTGVCLRTIEDGAS